LCEVTDRLALSLHIVCAMNFLDTHHRSIYNPLKCCCFSTFFSSFEVPFWQHLNQHVKYVNSSISAKKMSALCKYVLRLIFQSAKLAFSCAWRCHCISKKSHLSFQMKLSALEIAYGSIFLKQKANLQETLSDNYNACSTVFQNETTFGLNCNSLSQ
jgi:hypothetical protein